MPNPLDEALADSRPAGAPKPHPPAAKRPEKPKVDHTAARGIYARFLARDAELAPLRRYAERVARATGGPGMTPVAPLATMGCGGGPLLCDACGTPMLLEGGAYNKIPADVAWARNPRAGALWKSYISGGMVVEIACNGTLRIYHGYLGNDQKYCCNQASTRRAADELAHESAWTAPLRAALDAFLKDEQPALSPVERAELLYRIRDVLYDFDHGEGRNRPG